MRIYCDALDVFDDTTAYREMERLLMCVRRGQHTLLIDDLDRFYASRFFLQAVGVASQLEVKELLNQQDPSLSDRGLDPAARTHGPRAELVPIAPHDRACILDDGFPVWLLDGSTAGSWSEMPLRLLLENDADWQLIEVAARVYGRPHVTQAFKDGFLQKDQRGGKGEVRKSIESCRLNERVFVLVDSDRTTPSGPEGREQQDIRMLVKTRPNIFPFILAKREVENYVPAPIWRDAAEKRRHRNFGWIRKFREWNQLPDAHKDVVDMEAYFPYAKSQVSRLGDPTLVPDAQSLESRAGKEELVQLLSDLEAWL